jgi:hypothetical protein
MLASKDPGRHTIRWTVQGVFRRVLHLRPLFVAESGLSGLSGLSGEHKAEKPARKGPWVATATPDVGEQRSAKAVCIPSEDGDRRPLSQTAFSAGDEVRSAQDPQEHEENDGCRPVRPQRPLSGANRDVCAAEYEEGDI